MSAVPRSLKRQFPNLVKVTDAKLAVEVEVKEKDVNGATKGDATNCAMARAMCREWKADTAVIGMSYSYVIKGNTAVRYITPATVQREIVSFDRMKSFRPGKFHLAPVSPSQRLGLPHSGPKKQKKGHSPKRAVHHTVGVRRMPTG